ncbi:MAG: hypothetical protein WCV00_22040 [Verrucomicrobiia bacterium]
MKNIIVVGMGVLVMCMTVAGAEQQRLPLICGECPNELQAEDVAEIMKLATTKDSSSWLLVTGKLKWVKSLPKRVAVYLKPTVSTPRLRRGQMVWCDEQKRPRQETRSWIAGDQKHYAQVSPRDKPFTAEFAFPSSADKPFLVAGNIRDGDLVALVDFIRSNPREPMKVMNEQRTAEGYRATMSITEPVEGEYPILSVTEKERGSFEIFTERREGAGQSIRVKLQDGGWKLLGVSNWWS